MKERREQFECSYCGKTFNFRRDVKEHEDNCSQRTTAQPLSEAMIDETVAESFPASDPPSWTTGREIHNPSGESQDDELNSLSDHDLTQKAHDLNLAGRESMNREQLILAIRSHLSATEV